MLKNIRGKLNLCCNFESRFFNGICHFFYDWDYYSKHLIEVLYVHQGGLSSHGGAIGIFTVMFYFSRKVVKQSFYWMMDRVVIPTAICGCCIRFGNLMNSEIYGIPTDLPWGSNRALSSNSNL